MKRAGILLILSGILGLFFFAITDPRVAPGWIERIGWKRNLVDAVFDATAGTVLGLTGCLVIIVIGLWLLLRRSI